MRADLHEHGTSYFLAYLETNHEAWSKKQSCFNPPEPQDKTRTYFSSLSTAVLNTTNAPYEAFQLAFRNGFIVIDSGSDAVYRSYGCLYGVELYGGNSRVAFVPGEISVVIAVQKLFSALFIFLFGLALRNMLKMK